MIVTQGFVLSFGGSQQHGVVLHPMAFTSCIGMASVLSLPLLVLRQSSQTATPLLRETATSPPMATHNFPAEISEVVAKHILMDFLDHQNDKETLTKASKALQTDEEKSLLGERPSYCGIQLRLDMDVLLRVMQDKL